MEGKKNTVVTEKLLNPMSGWVPLFLLILGLFASIGTFVFSMNQLIEGQMGLSAILLIVSIVVFFADCIGFAGLKIVGQMKLWYLLSLESIMERLINPGIFM